MLAVCQAKRYGLAGARHRNGGGQGPEVETGIIAMPFSPSSLVLKLLARHIVGQNKDYISQSPLQLDSHVTKF